jgi:hypothetical protein
MHESPDNALEAKIRLLAFAFCLFRRQQTLLFLRGLRFVCRLFSADFRE